MPGSFICFKNGLTSSSSLHKISLCSRCCRSLLCLGGLGALFLTAAVCGVSNEYVIDRTGASSLSSFLSRPFSSDFPKMKKNTPAATVVTAAAPNV
jgi:hypothetical protein